MAKGILPTPDDVSLSKNLLKRIAADILSDGSFDESLLTIDSNDLAISPSTSRTIFFCTYLYTNVPTTPTAVSVAISSLNDDAEAIKLAKLRVSIINQL